MVPFGTIGTKLVPITKYYYAYIENHSYDDIVPETIKKSKQNPNILSKGNEGVSSGWYFF